MKIDLILKGAHSMRDEEGGVHIHDHTSSVTLIRNGEVNILVDTGSRGHFGRIEKALKKHGLTPNDIQLVVLTHFHLDHAYNVGFFPKARVIGWKHEWRHKSTFRFHNIHEMEIAKGVFIIHTPGHTPEHISVMTKDDRGETWAMGGDAIDESYIKTKKIHAIAYDERLYIKSAEGILRIADHIIPGHGKIIEVR